MARNLTAEPRDRNEMATEHVTRNLMQQQQHSREISLTQLCFRVHQFTPSSLYAPIQILSASL